MILNDTDKLLMVMRPYQVYAVEALVRQATLTNRNAYVWHTTGAGKTLTSFKTAQILAANPNIKKVIFLVDRKDLDSQTTEEFNKFENGSVDATDRTDVLVKQMQDKNRQLIVTTIQKMANAVKRPQYAKIMDAYKDEKVVFIIDECHRSQFGDMHKDIVRHFQKAQFFGFTGTPRFEVNGKVEGKITQTTEMLFGECVHNYLIKDAIFDNNVLGFHVEYIKTMEPMFCEDSYGYRPHKSALDAVEKTRKRCWKYDYVIELDVKGLFDNIDHELLMRVVRRHVKEPWICLYIERWLKSPFVLPDGSRIERESGTPQGGLCRARHNDPYDEINVMSSCH